MAEVTTPLTRRLILSASEVKAMTGWPSAMVEDYIEILRDLIILVEAINAGAGDILELQEEVDLLTAAVASLEARVQQNEDDIDALGSDVSDLQDAVDLLESAVTSLEARVSQNETDINNLEIAVSDIQDEIDLIESAITSLEARVSQNETDIAKNASDISDINDGRYSPQFGTGSPEGVVTANRNQTYYDLSGTPQHWVNPIIGANTGWVQVV